MSYPRDCYSCATGSHEYHVAHEGTPGLIGGYDCPCRGDCAERYAEWVADFPRRFEVKRELS